MKKLIALLKKWHYAWPYGYRWLGDMFIHAIVGIPIFLLLRWLFSKI